MKNLMSIRVLFPFTCIVIFLAACDLYPDNEARLEDLDMVTTYFDTNADFSEYQTYSIMDELRPISDNKNGIPIDISEATSDFILSQINNNLEALGYERVDTSNNPDLAINAGAVISQDIVISSYYPDYYYWNNGSWVSPGYWWGYYGYDYYYGWYPLNTVSSYEIGTVTIDMIDLKNHAVQDTQLNVLWTAVLRRIVSISPSLNRSRVKENIDQAFTQSPYLSKGGN